MPHSVSSSESDWSYDSDEDYRIAQQEWEESKKELRELVLVLVLPYLGRFLGRRTSYWLFDRYQRVGLGKSFFFTFFSR